MQKFEKGFFIGAATAAHQVEGNNTNSDYWAQEQLPHSSFTEPSGIACDHYHRYEEDIKLLADAGLNAYRFSIEWARVEPEEGTFDPEAIEHYRKVIACCKAHGVEPIVTLLHFTSPKWLICKGGWEAESTVEDFKHYAAFVMEQLGSELHYVCTINEANMGLQLAAISKRFRLMAEQAAKNAAAAGKSAEGTVQVGMNFQKMMENMKYAAMENAQVFGTPQPQIFVSERTPEGAELTQMDYEVYPQALEHVLRKVAEAFKGDLIVTENGIATADDTRRVAFIRRALDGVQHCIADGIPVKGYFHWSLMDNFEWQKGYAMQFGLIAVNRETMERTAKPSLGVLGSYAEK